MVAVLPKNMKKKEKEKKEKEKKKDNQYNLKKAMAIAIGLIKDVLYSEISSAFWSSSFRKRSFNVQCEPVWHLYLEAVS